MGTVNGGGTYSSGATATSTATPNSGYRFVRWQDNNTQNPRTVTANATYTAYFEANSNPGGSPVDDDCNIIVFPYRIDFNDGTSECWEVYDYSQDETTWQLYSTGDGGYCYGIQYAVNADDYLISPIIATPGNYRVEWKASAYDASYPETYYVYAYDGQNTTELFHETLTSTSFVNRNASFTVAAGHSVELYFNYVSDDMYALFIDDISIIQTTGIDDISWDGITIRTVGTTLTLQGVDGEAVYVSDITGRIVHTGIANAQTCIQLPSCGVYSVRVGDRPARKVVVMQ